MTNEQKLIGVLQNQRNQVMDALAMMEASLIVEREKNADLQKQVDELTPKEKAK